MEKYFVPKIDTPLEGVVTVPGSKSMTNRALLLATLSEEVPFIIQLFASRQRQLHFYQPVSKIHF